MKLVKRLQMCSGCESGGHLGSREIKMVESRM